MSKDRFLIAPLNAGQQTNLKPWLLPNNAFEELTNAYVYEGRVIKRFGSFLLNTTVGTDTAPLYSRLGIKLPIQTPGPANVTDTTAALPLKIGSMFAVGDYMFTVFQVGAGVLTLSTNGAATGTINTTVTPNIVTFTGLAPATDIYYYPGHPVMGLITYERELINSEPTYAFDTQYAYEFTGGRWERLGTAVWTGGDADFFWGDTWRGANANADILFVTNFVAADGIKYWDNSVWATLNPLYNATQKVTTARIVLPFKDRLVLLNVVEEVGGVDNTFQNRCRFSQNGSPLAVDSWRDDIAGKGGFVDCPIQEAIVSAQFIRDRLIVFFERSTWELVYTGNQILPFIWQQINTELGVESTFSVIPFDKGLLGVGNVGVHVCTGTEVSRIDQKIPRVIFQIHNENNGLERVYGIRDYDDYLVYWSYPDSDTNKTFPTKILVYNYESSSWSINKDSITCFGYFQNVADIRWTTTSVSWEETDLVWNDGSLQSGYRQIIGGNQQGFTFIVKTGINRNSPSLQITNLITASGMSTLTVIDHNLDIGNYVIIESANGSTGINDTVFQVFSTPSDDSIVITTPSAGGTYTGGGTLARISNIEILTKQYNFYDKSARNASISKVDFLVERTTNGQITIDSSPSTSSISLVNDGIASGALLGDSILDTAPYAIYPLEATQDRLWHSVHLQSEGEVVQLKLYMSDAQMKNTDISWSGFELNAMLFYASPTSYGFR